MDNLNITKDSDPQLDAVNPNLIQQNSVIVPPDSVASVLLQPAANLENIFKPMIQSEIKTLLQESFATVKEDLARDINSGIQSLISQKPSPKRGREALGTEPPEKRAKAAGGPEDEKLQSQNEFVYSDIESDGEDDPLGLHDLMEKGMQSADSEADDISPENKDDFLGDIEKVTIKTGGTPLENVKLAEKLSILWGTNVPAEQTKQLEKSILVPKNLESMEVQKMNDGLFKKKMNKLQQDRDKSHQRRQKLLTQAAVPIAQIMDTLLKVSHKSITKETLSELRKKALDSFTILSHANSVELKARKENLVSKLQVDAEEVEDFHSREGQALFTDTAQKKIVKLAKKPGNAPTKSNVPTHQKRNNGNGYSTGSSKNYQDASSYTYQQPQRQNQSQRQNYQQRQGNGNYRGGKKYQRN